MTRKRLKQNDRRGWFTVLATLALVFVVSIAPVAAIDPGVEPGSVTATLNPGESTTVDKTVGTTEIPPLVDIYLLEDESGSFFDDIPALQALAPDIWDDIDATGTNFTMGVAGFRDVDQSFWGSNGDWVYRQHQDLTDDRTAFVNGVNALSAGGGGDGPEAQLEALHYVADTSHPAIDSNGDGDTVDAQDTPAGQQPSWRSGATRVVLLATDAPCHVTGDAGGWPGDAGTTSPATTASILADQDIVVIGLVPGGAGTNACVDTLAAGTGGSVHATTADGSEIRDAILAGLSDLPAEVTPVVASSDPGLSVSFAPASQTVPSGDDASFTETVSVDADPALHGDTLTAEIHWLVNGELPGPEYVQTITVEVPPLEVDIDIKPGSDPNSINANNENGVITVAILSTDEFDATTVDHTTVEFEGASETHEDKRTGEPRRHEEDVDGDGDVDLVFHFRLGDTGLTADDVDGTLTGETFDGGAIEGTDSVRMVPSNRP